MEKESRPTRAAILKLLKKHGPQDAFGLSRRLGVTPMAVRLHLYRLAQQRFLSYEEVQRPMGRPAKLWQLTAAAAALFPGRYMELSLELLEGIKRVFGDRGLERILGLLGRKRTERYRQAINRDAPLPKRLKALCRAISEEGYMAEVVEGTRPGGLMIAQNHCPVLSAASQYRAICDAELRVVRQALGNAVMVERCEHVLSGGIRCSYRVSERGSADH